MRLIIFTLFLLLFSTASQADILLIVNAKNPVEQLEKRQVVDLFMGRVTAFPGGNAAYPLDLRSGTPLRGQFYRALTGQSEAQVDAYWATLIFAGRMTPPRQFPNEEALIRAVAETPSGIAFISNGHPLPSSVKVVMTLETN
jgi:hypothetical protein